MHQDCAGAASSAADPTAQFLRLGHQNTDARPELVLCLMRGGDPTGVAGQREAATRKWGCSRPVLLSDRIEEASSAAGRRQPLPEPAPLPALAPWLDEPREGPGGHRWAPSHRRPPRMHRRLQHCRQRVLHPFAWQPSLRSGSDPRLTDRCTRQVRRVCGARCCTRSAMWVRWCSSCCCRAGVRPNPAPSSRRHCCTRRHAARHHLRRVECHRLVHIACLHALTGFPTFHLHLLHRWLGQTSANRRRGPCCPALGVCQSRGTIRGRSSIAAFARR